MLNFQRAQEKAHQCCNLQTIFKVRAVPSDTQMRTILDGAPTEPLRARRPAWFEQMRRAGWAGQFRTGVPIPAGRQVRHRKTEEYYTLALDGSEYFHSTAIQCPQCLRKTTGPGVMHYRHAVGRFITLPPRGGGATGRYQTGRKPAGDAGGGKRRRTPRSNRHDRKPCFEERTPCGPKLSEPMTHYF